jgi:phosphoribosylglycinamide formyltransferase 2
MFFGSPFKDNSIKMMLLGSGELGREVAIEAQRLGIEVIAVDRYDNAPAHLVANRSHTIDMLDHDAVLELIEMEKPDYILPEVEAISISALLEAEKAGYRVIPNAEAVEKTMNRKKIREFASEKLGLKTSAYRFVSTFEELVEAAEEISYPCVIKPVMSSSGHGQSVARSAEDLESSWKKASEARGDASELIVEEFVDFDYEITLLTIRNGEETVFCDPIGHIQRDGDYILSWQPARMSPKALSDAKEMAGRVTEGLGGRGVYGVEFFVKGDDVYFSELSPRPHDTGMVTMATQSQSEFALHVRAVLGLPLGFEKLSPGASAAYKAVSHSQSPTIEVPEWAFGEKSFVRIFGKPVSHPGRRMAVALSTGETIEEAIDRAKSIVSAMSDS